MYNIYDANPNLYYLVSDSVDYSLPIVILNLEIEKSVEFNNLAKVNQHLSGKDIVRIGAYVDGNFYHIEQEIQLGSSFSTNAERISRTSDDPVLDTISSNSSWFIEVTRKTSQPVDAASLPATSSTSSTPELVDLDSTETLFFNRVGPQFFTNIQFVYGDVVVDGYLMGGFLTEITEWPAGTDNRIISLLYYNILANTPSQGGKAVLQVQLRLNRQYRYYSNSNTIEPNYSTTQYRIYDASFAMCCAGSYDFIYSMELKHGIPDESLNFVENIVGMYATYKGYGEIVSIAETISQCLQYKRKLTNSSAYYWPSDYNEHYKWDDDEKNVGEMNRAVHMVSEGCFFLNENDRMHCVVEVADRDYANSAATALLQKTFKFQFTYSLRSKNAILGFILGGDSCGEVPHSVDKTYTR